MRATSNPLHVPLDRLFARLNVLNGLIHLLDNQLRQTRTLMRQVFEKQKVDLSKLPFGTSLVVSDLSEWPENGARVHYASGGFDASGERYFEMADVLIARESAWTVSQGYEAFEKFLFDTSAAYLHAKPGEADAAETERFEKRGENRGTGPKELLYWQRFTRWVYRGRDNQVILNLLRRLAPDLPKGERNNNRRMDLCKWYKAASEVRHAATHSSLVIQASRYESALENESESFPCRQDGDVWVLDLRPKNAENALRLFAEYGFLVFKTLSQAAGYDWRIFGKDLPKGKKNA